MKKKAVKVIIERMPPKDEHDRQKFYRMVGKVVGSPEETWKTGTIPVASIVQKGTAIIDVRKAQLKKDVLKFWANYQALEEIDSKEL